MSEILSTLTWRGVLPWDITSRKLVPPIRIERTTNDLGKRCHHPTSSHSGSFGPNLAKQYEKIDYWRCTPFTGLNLVRSQCPMISSAISVSLPSPSPLSSAGILVQDPIWFIRGEGRLRCSPPIAFCPRKDSPSYGSIASTRFPSSFMSITV